MPLKVRKQLKETSQSLAYRFSQKLRKSRILFEVRKKRFKIKGKSRQLVKRSALRREQKKKEYGELKKLGRL